MGDEEELSVEELSRVVEIADGHLADAENVLWQASLRVESDEYADTLESLTNEVWELQHKLQDLKRHVDP